MIFKILNHILYCLQAESIFAFSSEPCTVNFAHFFLEQGDKTALLASTIELQLLQFLTKLVFECVTHDKLSMLSIWLKMIQVSDIFFNVALLHNVFLLSN